MQFSNQFSYYYSSADLYEIILYLKTKTGVGLEEAQNVQTDKSTPFKYTQT